jgi:hypothetical protein
MVSPCVSATVALNASDADVASVGMRAAAVVGERVERHCVTEAPGVVKRARWHAWRMGLNSGDLMYESHPKHQNEKSENENAMQCGDRPPFFDMLSMGKRNRQTLKSALNVAQ